MKIRKYDRNGKSNQVVALGSYPTRPPTTKHLQIKQELNAVSDGKNESTNRKSKTSRDLAKTISEDDLNKIKKRPWKSPFVSIVTARYGVKQIPSKSRQQNMSSGRSTYFSQVRPVPTMGFAANALLSEAKARNPSEGEQVKMHIKMTQKQ